MRHRTIPIALILTLGLVAPLAWGAKCPNLQIVLDRSGSMTSQLGGGTRWTVAKDAVRKILERYDGKLPIGISIFPAAGCDAETPVPPDYKTKAPIIMSIDKAGPSGSTPSGTAVKTAAKLAQLRDPERKQYIILITDGGPGCGGDPDTPAGTVNEIRAALMQSPSISTFVVGFGGGLAASEHDTLVLMAEAGGKAAMTPDKFYKADNADDLNKALETILEVVQGEFGGGACDDSCYATPCKNPGDMCVRANCAPNPCSGVSCGKDQYCYTDGVTPGTCVRACLKSCPKNTRCDKGACIVDPCGYACPASTVCNAVSKRCEPDPLCDGIPLDEQCKGSSRCQFGKCVDDPCLFVNCPTGTTCAHWDGSCSTNTVVPTAPDGGDGTVDPGDNRRSGCMASSGGAAAAPLASLASFLLVALLLRRRPRR